MMTALVVVVVIRMTAATVVQTTMRRSKMVKPAVMVRVAQELRGHAVAVAKSVHRARENIVIVELGFTESLRKGGRAYTLASVEHAYLCVPVGKAVQP